jgi:hypothetical protein
MDTVSLTVPAATFARLQAYAVPLVDTIDSVLLRLCDHYDTNPPTKPGYTRHVLETLTNPPEPTTFKTSRGVVLPLTYLHARYDGKLIVIQLTARGFEWNGQRFDDPSSVASAVKKSMGASETTASTNGWHFWLIGDGKTEGGVVLDVLRKSWVKSQMDRKGPLASRLA